MAWRGGAQSPPWPCVTHDLSSAPRGAAAARCPRPPPSSTHLLSLVFTDLYVYGPGGPVGASPLPQTRGESALRRCARLAGAQENADSGPRDAAYNGSITSLKCISFPPRAHTVSVTASVPRLGVAPSHCNQSICPQ